MDAEPSARGRSRRTESIRPGSTATAVCYRRTLRRRCQAARLWPGAIPIAEVSPYATIRCDLIWRLAVDASACWWSFSCGTGSPVSLASMHIRGHVGSHLSEWSCAGRAQPPRMHPLHNCNTMLPAGLRPHPDCPPFRTDARINRCFDVQRQTLRKALEEVTQNWSTARPTRSGCHSDVEHCAEPRIIHSLIAAEIRRAVQVAIARLH